LRSAGSCDRAVWRKATITARYNHTRAHTYTLARAHSHKHTRREGSKYLERLDTVHTVKSNLGDSRVGSGPSNRNVRVVRWNAGVTGSERVQKASAGVGLHVFKGLHLERSLAFWNVFGSSRHWDLDRRLDMEWRLIARYHQAHTQPKLYLDAVVC
jgi:hypothetical protein